MTEVYLILGSNLGQREAQLSAAKNLINMRLGAVLQHSTIYETASWGKEELPPHLNQVLLIETSLEPLKLLEGIHKIENELGRKRTDFWGARTMDIDILYFGKEIIEHERLRIPHPFLPQRRFVLVPLSEIAPQFMHPELHLSNLALLQACADPLSVMVFK